MRKLPKSIRPEEFIKLIKKVPTKNREEKTCYLLAYGSGMRISEVRSLTKDKIKGNIIEIRNSKYGVDRVVPLPKGWKHYMKDLLPIKKSIRTLQRNFKIRIKQAELDNNYTFHSLRHGFATRLVETGVPINQIQILMGHADISTTGIYLKARPKDALKSYEELF